ncbi:MAG TPA: tetratricopeptide repeat protein, partial [Candidatus Melainabacteria bacterium]|nr:tetratricopeptide repeat protein [Candidatus Melainabacteria bacterium]
MSRHKIMGMSDSSITSRFDKSFNRATFLRSSGDYRKALKSFCTAIDLSARLPDRSDARIYNCYLGAARCFYNLGEHYEAEAHYQNAIALIEDPAVTNFSLKASVFWELAVLYTEQKRFEEAAAFFERSISTARVSSDTEERLIADCFWGLSKCYCALRNLEAAEEAIRKAIKIYEHCIDDVDAAIATNRRNLANILIERNKYKEAFALLE